MQDATHDASVVIGASEYHKKTGITEQLRQAENSFREKFIDTQSGKVKRDYVSGRACPLCNSKDGYMAFVKNGFEHMHCTCGMVYVNEILKDEYMNLIYADSAYEGEVHDSFRSEPRKSFIEAIYQDGIELIKQAGISSGSLLDVGCSSGLFMEHARDRGFKVRGLEPSKYAVEAAKKHGLDAAQGYFIKGMEKDDSLEVITFWDVLEHCKQPLDILSAAYEALVPGGLIFLQVPNVMGLAPRIMKQDCNMFTGFGHINLFGPQTLKAAMEKNAFRDIQIQTVISEISVINNYLNYYDPYHGPSDQRDKVLGLINIEDIHKKLMGYKLQAVGRK